LLVVLAIGIGILVLAIGLRFAGVNRGILVPLHLVSLAAIVASLMMHDQLDV
jgi:hypothetical protein